MRTSSKSKHPLKPLSDLTRSQAYQLSKPKRASKLPLKLYVWCGVRFRDEQYADDRLIVLAHTLKQARELMLERAHTEIAPFMDADAIDAWLAAIGEPDEVLSKSSTIYWSYAE